MKRVLPVRIPVYIRTEIISGSKSYRGIIGNLSEYGIFAETVPTRSAMPFMPGKNLDFKFAISAKNTVNLNCEVVWLYTEKTPPEGLKNSIGVKIINPPVKYRKYLKTL